MKTIPVKSSNPNPATRFFENIANKIKAVKDFAEDVNMKGLDKTPSTMAKGLSTMYESSGTAKQISELDNSERRIVEQSRGIVANNIKDIFKGKNA